LGGVAVRVHDGLGQNLRVLFRPRPGRKVCRVRPADVHVAVDEREQIVAVRAGRVAQIDYGHMVAVVIFCDGAVVAGEIALGIQRQEAHAGGAGILQVGIQEKRGFADAGRADHQDVDVVRVYQRDDHALLSHAAEDDALCGRQFFSLPPRLRVIRDMAIRAFNFFSACPTGGAVLTVADGPVFDPV